LVGSSGPLPRPGASFGLFAAAVDARAAVDEEDLSAAVDDDDARAVVDEEDARAAVDDDNARAALDDDDGRAAVDDFAAVVTAGELIDLDTELAPTVFQSNGKKRTRDKSKTTGFVRPGVLFRVIGGAH